MSGSTKYIICADVIAVGFAAGLAMPTACLAFRRTCGARWVLGATPTVTHSRNIERHQGRAPRGRPIAPKTWGTPISCKFNFHKKKYCNTRTSPAGAGGAPRWVKSEKNKNLTKFRNVSKTRFFDFHRNSFENRKIWISANFGKFSKISIFQNENIWSAGYFFMRIQET